jgi:acetyl esterase/lipase
VLEPVVMRERTRATAPLVDGLFPPVHTERRIEMPGPRGPIGARLFYPDAESDGPYPVLLYFHGGGYLIGDTETCVHMTRQLCAGTGALVVSVDYRLAPEHPHPAPIEDCLAATRFMRAHAARFGGDPRTLGLAGDSAGAHAAVAVTLLLRDAGEPLPRALVLLCPWLDMTLSSDSYRRFAPTDPLLDHAMLRFVVDSYLQGHSARDPLASPVFADLSSLPEMLIMAGEIDPLYSEAVTFFRKLEAQGGTAAFHSYAGMPHDFMCFPWLDAARACMEKVIRFLRDVLQPASGSGARSVRARAG